MTVQLVGEVRPGMTFERGISQFPTVDDPVHLVTEDDLQTIYGRPNDRRFVQVGYLAGAESIPALIDIDKLVSRHSAVVGSTGAGKSTTVSGILTALSDAANYPSARIIVIDIHGEYGAALSDRAGIFKTSPQKESTDRQLFLPYWAMTFDELLPLTFGSIENQKEEVIDKITAMKKAAFRLGSYPGISETTITVDTPIPFSIHQLWFDLHCEMLATFYESADQTQSKDTWALEKDNNGEVVCAGDVMGAIPPAFRPLKNVARDSEKIRASKSGLNIRRQVDALGAKLRDPRFDFLFKPGPYLPDVDGIIAEDVDTLLSSWLGDDMPISILDLSGISPSIQSDLVGALLRIVYDSLFWGRNLPEGGRERPLLVVLEEAHSYLGEAENSTASRAVRRIAKEGRKYGIGIMLVSQRPSEIDQTILSQSGTILAMRLNNSKDRNQIKGAASDNLEGLFDMLPVLRTGETIIVGEAVNLPIRALIDRPAFNRTPDSADPKVVVAGTEEEGFESPGGWNQRRDPSDYSELVELWRKQDARSKNTSSSNGE
jgi:hypothetical protein